MSWEHAIYRDGDNVSIPLSTLGISRKKISGFLLVKLIEDETPSIDETSPILSIEGMFLSPDCNFEKYQILLDKMRTIGEFPEYLKEIVSAPAVFLDGNFFEFTDEDKPCTHEDMVYCTACTDDQKIKRLQSRNLSPKDRHFQYRTYLAQIGFDPILTEELRLQSTIFIN